MARNRERLNGLTYEVICDAISGDEAAEEQIYAYYEPYIVKLSKVPYYDNNNQLKYKIDEDIYMNLKIKLYEVLLKFRNS